MDGESALTAQAVREFSCASHNSLMASAHLSRGAWPTRITRIMRTVSLKGGPAEAGATAHTRAPASTAGSRSVPRPSLPLASSWAPSRSARWASRSPRSTRRRSGPSRCARRTRPTAPAKTVTAAATESSAGGARSGALADSGAPRAAHPLRRPRRNPARSRPRSRPQRLGRLPGPPRRRVRSRSPSPLLRLPRRRSQRPRRQRHRPPTTTAVVMTKRARTAAMTAATTDAAP
jgi:hypothetical protein